MIEIKGKLSAHCVNVVNSNMFCLTMIYKDFYAL